MRAHMPRKKIISMILKYVCVYLAIAIVAGWIATTALYNNLIQYEREARKSGFQLSLDSCQEYLDKSRLPIRDCLAMIYARAFIVQADFNIFQDHLPLEVRAYVALEDPETKEILADNGENVFFIVRFYDGEEVEESSVEGDQYEPKIMYSPVTIFEEGYLALREGQASLKGWLGERVRSKATWEEFYDEETIRCVLLDFYQKGDGSILPGKVLLLRREGKNWRFNSKVAIDPDSVETGDQIVV
ncbi:MAG: hypothetical protein J5546_11445, partial [Lachnospiraceae bacterium]|nr:hypothetical protein [Lachnospiraceae bacterium]